MTWSELRVLFLLVASAQLAGCAGVARRPEPEVGLALRTPVAASFSFAEHAVTIPAPGLLLEGTLSVPRAAGPRPAVVLIHGSGPMSRDESMSGQLGDQFGHSVRVFLDLARHLARAGFVVLRYDKRTCTVQTGCQNRYPIALEVGFDQIVEDVQAAIDWLGRRPEVDSSRLNLLGHSLGGSLVPELMTDNPQLATGVVLAAPYRPIDQISAYQEAYARRRASASGRHPLLVGIQVRSLAQIANGTRRLRQGILRESHIVGVSVDFWSAWMDQGDALPALVSALNRPLLVLSGAADSNVPASETALWKQLFDQLAPSVGHRAHVLPCLSHALNCIDRRTPQRPSAARHVGPAVLERVTAFLLRHNRARAKSAAGGSASAR